MIRQFDPAKDTKEQLLDLWNLCYGTNLFTLAHFERLNLANIIVIEENNGMVGFAFLLDGGMPYAVLDQLYLLPRYNRFTTLRDVMVYVEALCAERGIKWLYALMNGTGGEAEQSVDLLKRRAKWNSQYLGEKPLLCKSIS